MLFSTAEAFRFPGLIRTWAVPVLAVLLGAVLLGSSMLSHDISWYLISTGWWLDGLPIYEKISELNPPLAFYLTAPPVWFAELSGLTPTTSFKIYVFGLIVVSLLLSNAILSRCDGCTSVQKDVFVGAAAISLVLLPLRDFGQRDHLFAIFFLPYLVMNFPGVAMSRGSRAMVAVWGTLGIALKHYFVLLPLLILIFHVIRARSLRPLLRVEFLLPAGLLLVYVAASVVLHPAYFDSVIPVTLKVYGTFKNDLSLVVAQAVVVILVLSMAIVVLALTPEDRAISGLLILVAIGALAVFLIQSKGWSYQRVPADIYTGLAITWAIGAFAQSRHSHMAWALAVVALGLLLVPALRHGPYQNGFYKQAAAYFECAPGQRSFQVFGSNVSTGFPLANYANAEPANRAPTLWQFPGAAYHLSQTDDPTVQAEYTLIMHKAREMVLEDFFRVSPQMVVVDSSLRKDYFGGAEFDYIEYFSKEKTFAAAWQAYEKAGNIAHFDIYMRPGCD